MRSRIRYRLRHPDPLRRISPTENHTHATRRANLLILVPTAALFLLVGAGSSKASPNLVVDGSQSYQRVAAVGVNINVNSWNNGALRPALDLLVRPADSGGAGMKMFRVVRDPMTWVTSEADIPLLHALDAATLRRIYEAPAMQDLWSTIAYLDSIGVPGDHIVLNFQGWTPTWLGGSGAYGVSSYLTSGKEAELATMIASLVFYGRWIRGLDFKLLGPANEPDWNCLEGPCIGSAQYVVFLRALISELNSMDQTDIRLIGPDTSSEVIGSDYIAAMMGDATIPGRVDHFGLHNYGAPGRPGNPYAGHDYWLDETGASCVICDNGGSPPQGEWEFATQTFDIILGSFANGMSMASYWDGYDSFYYVHNSSLWGLLAYDSTTATYTPRKRFFAVSQASAFVKPGSRLISETDALGGLGPTAAFFDSTSGLLTIIGRNTSSSAITIDGQLNNLPTISQLTCTMTDPDSLNLTVGAVIPVTGGSFTATIPPLAIFSLASCDPAVAAVGSPRSRVESVSDARPNPTKGGADFVVTLSGPAAVSLQILDVQGRMLWQAPPRRYEAGRWTLPWDGRTAGGPAPAGIYMARIRAGEQVFARSIAIIR